MINNKCDLMNDFGYIQAAIWDKAMKYSNIGECHIVVCHVNKSSFPLLATRRQVIQIQTTNDR